MAEATHTPQPLAPPSKLQTYTHTHTHTRACACGKGGVPRGLGGQEEEEEKAAIAPNHVSTEPRKVHNWPGGVGEHRGAKHTPAPRPGTAPRLRRPASSCLPLKTTFFSFCKPLASQWHR